MLSLLLPALLFLLKQEKHATSPYIIESFVKSLRGIRSFGADCVIMTVLFTTYQARMVSDRDELLKTMALFYHKSAGFQLGRCFVGAQYEVVIARDVSADPKVNLNVMTVKREDQPQKKDLSDLITISSAHPFSRHVLISNRSVRFELPAMVCNIPVGPRGFVYVAYKVVKGYAIYEMEEAMFKRIVKQKSLLPPLAKKAAATKVFVRPYAQNAGGAMPAILSA